MFEKFLISSSWLFQIELMDNSQLKYIAVFNINSLTVNETRFRISKTVFWVKVNEVEFFYIIDLYIFMILFKRINYVWTVTVFPFKILTRIFYKNIETTKSV